jgi:hypothetical protein
MDGLNGLLKRQGEQNERAMHNILGHAGRKVKQEAKERILARQEEQRNRQVFHMLQDPGNKQKLRPPHVLTPVLMGFPLTLANWNKKDSDKWCRKHVPNLHSGRRIIDVVSDNDKMDSYYEEGKKMYTRRPTGTKRTRMSGAENTSQTGTREKESSTSSATTTSWTAITRAARKCTRSCKDA